MRCSGILAAAVVAFSTSLASAAQIQGEYLEARSCDVYTGPCFANAEMDLAGKEALMAWKIEEGGWNNVDLAGLGAALVLHSQKTLGYDGVFPMQAGKISSVILVDEKADAAQREALVRFVKATAKEYTQDVQRVEPVPFSLENDHLSGVGKFRAGDLASIETRALKKDDCVCTNEIVFYLPLTKVKNYSPAFSQTLSFEGEGLNNTWTTHNLRSAFLATFRK